MDYKATWRVRTRIWCKELLGGCCAQCGSVEDLEFDHVDPATKEFDISQGIVGCYSRARLQAELIKCQLLCKSCHVRKSATEVEVEHGGGETGKRNCRCELCAPLKREYARKRKRALVAQSAERGLGKTEVSGSIPPEGSM